MTRVALGRDDVVKGGVNQSHGLNVLSRRMAKIFRAGFQDFRAPEEGRRIVSSFRLEIWKRIKTLIFQAKRFRLLAYYRPSKLGYAVKLSSQINLVFVTKA